MSSQHEDFIIEDDDDDSLEKKPQAQDEQGISDDEEHFEEANLIDKIDFSVPQIVVCVGKPKRGKSNAVKWFILLKKQR